jgi:TonB family protein
MPRDLFGEVVRRGVRIGARRRYGLPLTVFVHAAIIGMIVIVPLVATIDAGGQVINARVLRSVPLFDQAAVDAVRQWEFTPTRLNGVTVPVVTTVTANVTLK